MPLTRRRFTQALLTGLTASLLPAVHAAELVEGRDWTPVSPLRPGSGGDRIEILEFFSYGCPHCRDLNPLITRWAAGLPGDVAFRRVPVSFGRAAWANLARLYYALELSGDLDRLDQAVFDAIHQNRSNLYTRQRIIDWIGRQGVDADTFGGIFDSFAVRTRLNQGDRMVRDYAVDAVPMIAVDGRYKPKLAAGRGFKDLLDVTDQLIELARRNRQR